jgi:hypothetical protein
MQVGDCCYSCACYQTQHAGGRPGHITPIQSRSVKAARPPHPTESTRFHTKCTLRPNAKTALLLATPAVIVSCHTSPQGGRGRSAQGHYNATCMPHIVHTTGHCPLYMSHACQQGDSCKRRGHAHKQLPADEGVMPNTQETLPSMPSGFDVDVSALAAGNNASLFASTLSHRTGCLITERETSIVLMP